MKKYLYFSLNDIFILNNTINNYHSFFDNLNKFCKINDLDLYLISEFRDDYSKQLVSQFNLDKYFCKENVVCVSEQYINSLNDITKDIKRKEYKDNFKFKDKYFKVFYFNEIFKKNKDDVLLIGSDLLTDGYYVNKYANVDFVILKSIACFNNKAIDISRFINISVIEPSLKDIKPYLNGSIKFNYTELFNFTNNYLLKRVVGDLNILSNKNIKDLVVDTYKNNKTVNNNDNV